MSDIFKPLEVPSWATWGQRSGLEIDRRGWRRGENGRPFCSWCKVEVPPRRRKWCSDECSAKYGRVWNWAAMRVYVKERDAETCQRCGTKDPPRPPHPRLDPWDVDHIKQVTDGGTDDLDNLRLLCMACHNKVGYEQRGTAPQRTKMKYAIVPLEELRAADYNPRVTLQPGDENYEQIKASLAEFSQVLPVVFNERTNRIVGGHQRVNILAEQGKDSALVVYVDVPEEEEKLLNIGLNRIGERDVMWDRGPLDAAISQLDDELLEITGFTRPVDDDVEPTPDPDTLSRSAKCGWGDFTAEVDPDVVGEVVGLLGVAAAVQDIESEGVLDLLLNEMMDSS